jgi:hypothetical protein
MKNNLYRIIKENVWTLLIENIETGEQVEIWKSEIVS